MTTLCTNLLSDLGVLGSIEVQEFQLGLIPLEKDVLSLESDDAWRRLALVSVLCELDAAPGLRVARLTVVWRSRRTATRPRCTTWPRR